MSVTHTLSDSQVMVTRCVRRSLRNPEAFFTALVLPIVLMLLFVYVFGGDLATGGKYVNYVVPGLIVLCAGFGASTTAVAVATDMSNGTPSTSKGWERTDTSGSRLTKKLDVPEVNS